jgi:nuclear GTP-binding protein
MLLTVMLLTVKQVLDARDPLGCRCPEVERLVLAASAAEAGGGSQGAAGAEAGTGEKRIILLLNKVDLVPPDVVQQWIRYFRREYPCIAFKSSTQHQSGQLASNRGVKSLGQMDSKTLKQRGSVGGAALLELLKNYSRSFNMKKHITVGVSVVYACTLSVSVQCSAIAHTIHDRT